MSVNNYTLNCQVMVTHIFGIFHEVASAGALVYPFGIDAVFHGHLRLPHQIGKLGILCNTYNRWSSNCQLTQMAADYRLHTLHALHTPITAIMEGSK